MFKYCGRNESISTAVEVSNGDFLMESVTDYIKNSKPFDMCTAENEYISEQLELFLKKVSISVKVYRPWWRWSKAYGYFSAKNPTTINLNMYKLNRSVSSLVGTFYHEAVHMMDHFDNGHSFGHGDNSPVGKENTAPYWIGNLAKGFSSGRDINFNNKDGFL